ncbi:MAG: DUF1302 domain-containing protein, partial [Nevskiales bacterium]
MRFSGDASARTLIRALLFSSLYLLPGVGQAITVDWDIGSGIQGTINTELSVGAQWRMEDRANHLIGKANLNPSVCPNSCQGHAFDAGQTDLRLLGITVAETDIPGTGPGANQRAVDAPGMFSANHDNGNLNYDQYDLTQAVAKIKQDISLSYAGIEFFARYYFFYDVENYDRKNFRPNVMTPAAVAAQQARINSGQYGTAVPGEAIELSRSSRDREQNGSDFRLLDFNVTGYLPFIGDRELGVTVGRQQINWGESTVIIVNSLNTLTSPDLNALYRPAFLNLDEVLRPVPAIKLGTDITDTLSAEIFYQYDWEGVEIPAPGNFMSFLDVGTNNNRDTVNLAFGKVAEDPFRIGRAEESLLSAVSDIRGDIRLRPQNEPEDGGQYGLALNYYADWLNDGTELRFYAANYHSRLPYLSFYGADLSCAANLMPTNDGVTGILSLVNPLASPGAGDGCPNADVGRFLGAVTAGVPVVGQPLLAAAVAGLAGSLGGIVGGDGTGPLGEAYPLSTAEAILDYPEDIRVYGISFNTAFGDLSLQGEVSYRPNLPVQIDEVDLAFAALNPAAPYGCLLAGSGCAPGSRDDSIALGLPGAPGVVDPLEAANLAGRRHAFPDLVTAYRGRTPGSVLPGEYIQGYERLPVAQYILGATYIIGPKNWLNADQIILFGEVGATHILDYPNPCELPLDGPGTTTHITAGADGTGTASGGGHGVCSAPGDSVYDAPSGVRFNPTQQDPDGYADEFAWGYRMIAIIRYESVFPGISFEPIILFADDVKGTAPGPGENFLEGRQNIVANVEMRVGNRWSFSAGYAWFRGAEPYNLISDRDFA